jgi:hypothetical protein
MRNAATTEQAAANVEEALDELKTKWREQVVPPSRNDVRPIAYRLAGAWSSIRDRLITYETLPASNRDRERAIAIHDSLFPDGVAFVKLAAARVYAESERRIDLIDERRFAKDLARLVGDRFVAALRADHEAYGDAFGLTKLSPLPAEPVVVVELLRKLVEAISRYALQLLAAADHDPDKREAIAFALFPIEEFRAAASRRVTDDDDEEDEPAANDPAEPDPQATGTDSHVASVRLAERGLPYPLRFSFAVFTTQALSPPSRTAPARDALISADFNPGRIEAVEGAHAVRQEIQHRDRITLRLRRPIAREIFVRDLVGDHAGQSESRGRHCRSRIPVLSIGTPSASADATPGVVTST